MLNSTQNWLGQFKTVTEPIKRGLGKLGVTEPTMLINTERLPWVNNIIEEEQ